MPECKQTASYETHEVTKAKQLGPLLTRLSEAGYHVAINAPHESSDEPDEDEDPELAKLKPQGPWLVTARRYECRCVCSRCGDPVAPQKESK